VVACVLGAGVDVLGGVAGVVTTGVVVVGVIVAVVLVVDLLGL
jgi:hypothetical protein